MSLHSSGGRKSKVRVSVWSGPGESPPSAVTVSSFPLVRTPVTLGHGPLVTSFHLNHRIKDSVSEHSHIWGCWGVRALTCELGAHSSTRNANPDSSGTPGLQAQPPPHTPVQALAGASHSACPDRPPSPRLPTDKSLLLSPCLLYTSDAADDPRVV